MEPIRKLNFDEFKHDKLEQGYEVIIERRWEPNVVNDFHQHDFTADVLVVDGDFWLTAEGDTKHFEPGDTFYVPVGLEHKEKYGPNGCVCWVARL